MKSTVTFITSFNVINVVKCVYFNPLINLTDSFLKLDKTLQNTEELKNFIRNTIQTKIPQKAFNWLTETADEISAGCEDWAFFSSFSMVPRHTGKKPFSLSESELQTAETLRPGWKPEYWTLDELGRCYFVLALAGRGETEFLDKLNKLHTSADMGESVALYKGLAIWPFPEQLKARAAEGIRHNITTVFNAVALRNPYPADFLDEPAWNQMVLKALFVESPLYLIQGIDKRANAELARMLIDFSHERKAAGRRIPPELWRPVGPYIQKEYLPDLETALENEEQIIRQAALLALLSGPEELVRPVLEKHQSAVTQLKEKNIGWDEIGKKESAQN